MVGEGKAGANRCGQKTSCNMRLHAPLSISGGSLVRWRTKTSGDGWNISENRRCLMHAKGRMQMAKLTGVCCAFVMMFAVTSGASAAPFAADSGYCFGKLNRVAHMTACQQAAQANAKVTTTRQIRRHR